MRGSEMLVWGIKFDVSKRTKLVLIKILYLFKKAQRAVSQSFSEKRRVSFAALSGIALSFRFRKTFDKK